jgi:polyphosphate kinase
VKALNDAVQWGVQVIVFVRNISFLTPEERLFTSKIRVISYVGRLLEHHRVYCFKTSDQEKIFLGSCNMVKKNIDKRIELIFPIYQPSIQSKIKEEIIDNIQKNTNHCWEMDHTGAFQFIKNETLDFQTALIEKYAKK